MHEIIFDRNSPYWNEDGGFNLLFLRAQERYLNDLAREVKKKAGYEVDIQLNEFTATVTDGTAHVHLNVDAELGKDELTKLLAAIGL